MKTAPDPPDQNDRVIAELESLSAALNAWNSSLILGGGVALIVYDRCMARSEAQPVGTTDMDFLIPRKPAVPANAEPVSKALLRLGFTVRRKNTGTPPIESYVREAEEMEFEVEFLTDDRVKAKTLAVEIKEAGVVAQALSYLEMSFAHATEAKLPSGAGIRVVTPEAWVFHKGLTFVRRPPKSSKQYKDLYGIWFVLTQMDAFSATTLVRLKDLQARQHANWKKAFLANLTSWIAKASPGDWSQLIAQDPQRRLTEVRFKALVESLAKA
jgi:hypothetical protein